MVIELYILLGIFSWVLNAPTLLQSTPDQEIISGESFNITIPVSRFSDPDYSIYLSVSGAPSWMKFSTHWGETDTVPQIDQTIVHHPTLPIMYASAQNSNKLYILNTTVLENPSVIDTIDGLSVLASYLVIDGDYLYVPRRASGFSIFNISDPVSPVSEYSTGGSNFLTLYPYLNQTRMIAASLTNRLRVYDTDPIKSTSFLHTFGSGSEWDISVDYPYAYSAGSDGFKVWNIVNEGSEVEVFNDGTDARKVYKRGNFVYTCGDGKFRVHDCTDPENPVFLGPHDLTITQCNLIHLEGDHVFVAYINSGEEGIHDFKLTFESGYVNVTEHHHYPGEARGVYGGRNVVYLSDYNVPREMRVYSFGDGEIYGEAVDLTELERAFEEYTITVTAENSVGEKVTDEFKVRVVRKRCFDVDAALDSVCGGHGSCVSNDSCVCTDEENYFGDDCSVTTCNSILSNDSMNVCSGHGYCLTKNQCNCSFGFEGEDCSENVVRYWRRHGTGLQNQVTKNVTDIHVYDSRTIPGSRTNPCVVKSSNDCEILIMFGNGRDFEDSAKPLGEVWSFDFCRNEYKLLRGEGTQNSVVGVKGVYGSNDIPGSRKSQSCAKISDDEVAILLGIGYPSSGGTCNLDEIWVYKRSTNEFKFQYGSDDCAASTDSFNCPDPRNFSASNRPGSLEQHRVVSWDGQGQSSQLFGLGQAKILLFGGRDDANKYTNGLYFFDPTKGTYGQWRCEFQTPDGNDQGIYVNKGQFSPSGYPGSRITSIVSQFANDDILVFGGYGKDKNDATGRLNDVWIYRVSIGEWKWASGSDLRDGDAPGNFTSSKFYDFTPENHPRSTYTYSGTYISNSNEFIGGFGYIVGTQMSNRLWLYSILRNEWMLITGKLNGDEVNEYSLKGTRNITQFDPGHLIGSNSGITNLVELKYKKDSGLDGVIMFGGTGCTMSACGVNRLQDVWVFGNNRSSSCGSVGSLFNTTCSSHGFCVDENLCDCDDNYSGVNCEEWKCFGEWNYNSQSVCSGNGNCVEIDDCKCRTNHFGYKCQYEKYFVFQTGSLAGGVKKGNYSCNGDGKAFPGGRARLGGTIFGSTGAEKMVVFGGYGVGGEEENVLGHLGDLWKFEISTSIWCYVKGSTGINSQENSVGSSNNLYSFDSGHSPGSRSSYSFFSTSFSFFMFGGDTSGSYSFKSNSTNEVWENSLTFNRPTYDWRMLMSKNEPFEQPIGRSSACMAKRRQSSTSSFPSVFLFGGIFYDSESDQRKVLNDFWRYEISLNRFFRLDQNNTNNFTVDFPNPSWNQTKDYYSKLSKNELQSGPPSHRFFHNCWVSETSGNFYVFGGTLGDYESTNDVWAFNSSEFRWSWVHGGPTENNKKENHVVEFYEYNSQNVPSARSSFLVLSNLMNIRYDESFVDEALFYGGIFWSLEEKDTFSDVWSFSNVLNEFKFVNGSVTPNVVNSESMIGSRYSSVGGRTLKKNFLIFGGEV